jgi:hypothetical protein
VASWPSGEPAEPVVPCLDKVAGLRPSTPISMVLSDDSIELLPGPFPAATREWDPMIWESCVARPRSRAEGPSLEAQDVASPVAERVMVEAQDAVSPGLALPVLELVYFENVVSSLPPPPLQDADLHAGPTSQLVSQAPFVTITRGEPPTEEGWRPSP